MSKKVEFGFALCRRGGKVSKGTSARGTSTSVTVPFHTCPKGSELFGVHHSHPGGTTGLSPQDIATAHRFGLRYVCVKAGGRVKCHRTSRR